MAPAQQKALPRRQAKPQANTEPVIELEPAAYQPVTFREFRDEITDRSDEIAKILPPNVSREKFIATAIIAVKNNPDLLVCDRRSLHAAVTKAAEDGLQPDGREGVINVYNEKRKSRNDNGAWIESWVKVACWIPMTYGIRKRARELCGMIIDAQIVHEKDKFVWRQGDEPRIEHEPCTLSDDPGAMIGVYAIFKQEGVILHREVMRAKQVMDVKSCVKAQNGLLWTKFETEAWRKSAVRRGIKTVPSVPDTLKRIVERDDDQYEFDRRAETIALAATSDVPEIPEIPDDVPELPPDDEASGLDDPAGEMLPEVEQGKLISKLKEDLALCKSYSEREEVAKQYEDILDRLSDANRRRVEAIFEGREK